MVAVAGSFDTPTVLDRRRIEIADRAIRGSVQPYHEARELGIDKAEKYLKRCVDASRVLAQAALEKAIGDLRGYRVTCCGMLLGSGRLSPTLEATLASHPSLHTAEGEFFRDVLRKASEQFQLPCHGVKEKELLAVAAARFGVSAEEIQRRLNGLGKTLGAPWRQDQKFAALAGWLALWRDL